MRNILKFSCLFLVLALGACSEARYAAHLVKQIPMPGDSSGNVGSFKVGTPYKIMGKRYYPKESYDLVETGIASWYGPNFHGKPTANGETFNKHELTAAHRTLQMPSIIRVTNLQNGRSIIMRVNDRGPFSRGRILDVSERGAELLGFKNQGTAKVRVEVLRKESLEVAQAAKQGFDTRGMEVAYNNRRVPTQIKQQARQQTRQQAEPVQIASRNQTTDFQNNTTDLTWADKRNAKISAVEREPLTELEISNIEPASAPSEISKQGISKQIVQDTPVLPSNIFVQAGSFSSKDNAVALSQKLNALAPVNVKPAVVNGTPFYRVRVGPFEQVAQADTALNSLIAGGHNNAMIIVD